MAKLTNERTTERLLTKERLLTAAEVAEILKVSHMTVRRMFRDHPHVVKLGPRGRKNKRDHVSIRIPESVLNEELQSTLG